MNDDALLVELLAKVADAAVYWHRKPADAQRQKDLHDACKALQKAGWYVLPRGFAARIAAKTPDRPATPETT